jgi:Na+-driven multidrug efflux pump
MILIFIIGISLVQFGLYYLNEKQKTKFPSFIILAVLLICCFFVFPRFFYPEPDPDGINCGMPILGITLGFWIFGTIAGIVTHVVWKLKLWVNAKHNVDEK